jgi:hypothetical protein
MVPGIYICHMASTEKIVAVELPGNIPRKLELDYA